MTITQRVENPSHRVLVYGREAQLIEAAGGFLAEALAAGGASVALATAPHLRSLDEWVRLCGHDVDAAETEHRYHPIAIETTLRSLDRDANPAAAFEARLGAVLDAIPSGTAPVHIFGEAAAALWERRQVAAALTLEAVSGTMRPARPVSLLCAYADGVLAGTEDAEEAPRRHTDVLQAPPFPTSPHEAGAALVSSAVLPPAPAACRTARRLVRAAFAGENGAGAVDTAELLLGELAANAVRHAGSTFTAEVLSSNGTMRLAVTDAAPLPVGWEGFPVARDHGLGLVAALAKDWAVEPLAGGKTVWAEVAREGT